MTTLDDIRAEIAGIAAKIDSYRPLLTCGALLEIAQKQGWKVRNGHGDHRVLYRSHYDSITMDCPGRGSEKSRAVTRKILIAIYQPAIDEALKQGLAPAVTAQIEQLTGSLSDCLNTFEVQAHQQLRALQAEAYTELDQVKAAAAQRIEQYEAERLSECAESVSQLMNEEQKRLLAEQQQELEQQQQELKGIHHQINVLEGELERSQFQSTQAQQEFTETRHLLQQVEAQYQTAQTQLSQTQSYLRRAESQLETLAMQLSQANLNAMRYRKRQRWKDVLTLASLGVACILAFTPFRPQPLSNVLAVFLPSPTTTE